MERKQKDSRKEWRKGHFLSTTTTFDSFSVLFLSPFIVFIIPASILLWFNRLSVGRRFRHRSRSIFFSVLWSSNSFLLSRHRLWRAHTESRARRASNLLLFIFFRFFLWRVLLLSRRINVVCASRVDFTGVRWCVRWGDIYREMVVDGETGTRIGEASSERASHSSGVFLPETYFTHCQFCRWQTTRKFAQHTYCESFSLINQESYVWVDESVWGEGARETLVSHRTQFYYRLEWSARKGEWIKEKKMRHTNDQQRRAAHKSNRTNENEQPVKPEPRASIVKT